jgi:ribosomal protein L16 Arg81 hydroxylase
VEPAEFAAEYWGRRPLHSPADRPGSHPDGFTDLLSPAAVDELLSRRGLRTPFIRMARDGRVVDAGRYTRPGGAGALVGDQVADDRVLELFADGHTIVLQGLHRLWPPLVELAGQLTTETGHPVQVNAYVTPASSTGFSAHYDVHDVFVLQVAGTKRWRIHEPVRPDPLRDEPWTDRRDAVTARAAEPPLLETVLGPGDALYLPRGYLHAAEALGEVSIHLTVGVQPVTREAIVQALAELAADDPALRASLPLGVDVGEPAAVAADVTATVQALVRRLQSATPEEVARRLATRLAGSHRPAPLAPLAQAAALARLGPGTVLAPRRHLRHATWHEADELVLLAADRTLRLPVTTAKAVHALLADGPLRVDELPGLGPEDALALARRLVREGVAVPVDAGE